MRFTDDDTQKRFTAEGFTDAEILELRFQGAISSKTGGLGYFVMDEGGAVDWIETRTYTIDQQAKTDEMLNNYLNNQNTKKLKTL